jgi:beta-lactamase superfamily II metal-dependent hydrolase
MIARNGVRYQIVTRNQFREVGINWHTIFPPDEVLSGLVAKKKGLVVDESAVPSIIMPETPPPQEEVEEIIPPLQQVDEVIRSQPKKTEKYGSRVKSLLNLSQRQLSRILDTLNVHIDKVISEHVDEKHAEDFTFLLEMLVAIRKKKEKKPEEGFVDQSKRYQVMQQLASDPLHLQLKR